MLYQVITFDIAYDILSRRGFSYDACRYLYDYYNSSEDWMEFDDSLIAVEWSEHNYYDYFIENRQHISTNVEPGDPYISIKSFVLDHLLQNNANFVDLGDSFLVRNC